MTRNGNNINTPGGQSTRHKTATAHSDSGGGGPKRENESERSDPRPTKKTHTFFGTLNIQTLIQVGKIHTLTEELKKQKIMIIALQETRFTNSETAEYNDYRIFKSKTTKIVGRNTPALGVAFLVNKKIVNSVVDVKPINGRLMTLRIKHKNKHYTFVNAHAPTNETNKKEPKETDEYWELLETTLAKIPKNDTKILLGDFNAQLGKEKKYKKTIGEYPAHKFTNTNGKRLVDTCRQFNLKIMSTSLRKKPKKQKTWRSPNSRLGEYQIDHVAISYDDQRNVHDIQVRRGANIDSDHYLTRIKIKMTPINHRKNKAKPIPKFDLRKIQKTNLADQWENIRSNNWNEFKTKIIETSKQTIPLLKKPKHPWWNEDCDHAIEIRKNAYQIYNTHRNETSHQNFLKTRKLSNKIIRQQKRKYINEQLRSIEENFRNYNTHNFYKIFAKQIKGYTPKNLCFKKSDGKLALTNKENCQELAKYFKDLLNCPEPTERFPKITKEKHPDSPAPDLEEVKNHIKKLKNNKTSGEDGIVAEFLKNTKPKTLREITQIIQNIWNNEEIPEDWTTALIHPLHKKGDRTNVNNYRGISLLSVPYKILSSCLRQRVQDQAESKIAEYQAGFRPNRACPEQIHNLKSILKIKMLRHKPVVCTFVDFKKAYDSIDRQSLFDILEEYGIDDKTRKIIQLTLKNTKSKIKFIGEISEPFEIKTGVRQGDGLSPLLFNIALDKVMKEWKKLLKDRNQWNPMTLGPRKTIPVPYLAFADDLAILTENIDTARNATEALKECAERIGLQISFEKTEFFATKTEAQKLETKYGSINRVKHFKYLGEIIEPTGQEKIAQQIRISKVKKALPLTQNIYNKKCISNDTKVRHYKTVIEPMALYASETMALNRKGQLEELKKEERKIIRKILGPRKTSEGYRLQHTSTVEEKSNIEADIRKRRLRFFGHIHRLPETRLTKQIHDYVYKLKNTTTWIKQVKTDLQAANIQETDITDRDTFRRKVYTWKVESEPKKKTGCKWTAERKEQHSKQMKILWQKRKEKQRLKA